MSLPALTVAQISASFAVDATENTLEPARMDWTWAPLPGFQSVRRLFQPPLQRPCEFQQRQEQGPSPCLSVTCADPPPTRKTRTTPSAYAHAMRFESGEKRQSLTACFLPLPLSADPWL